MSMGRITGYNGVGKAYVRDRLYESKVLERLAAYEDFMDRWHLKSIEDAERIFRRVNDLGGTDLMAQYRELGSINHLRDLLQAEKSGQLVVLPCKVGDSVYIPDLEKKIPIKVRVQGISISVSGRTILHFGGYPVECAWGDGCGKDWFLTSKETEAALSNVNTIPCKHGISRHRNEIGEDEVYCELNAKWMNVTLGDCLGNCESEAALSGKGGDS